EFLIRVQNDEMPACSVVTIVVGDIVPIIEVGGCYPVALVLMITDGWIGDIVELPKMTVTCPIPVMKFGICPPVIHITEIDKHIRIPRIDQRWDFGKFATGTIAGRGNDHLLSRRNMWREATVIDRR